MKSVRNEPHSTLFIVIFKYMGVGMDQAQVSLIFAKCQPSKIGVCASTVDE